MTNMRSTDSSYQIHNSQANIPPPITTLDIGQGLCGTEVWRERERERLSLSAFLGTEDIGVRIVHISRVIITYTLE